MSESTELVVLQNLNPVLIFTEGGTDPLLEAIKKEVSTFIADISTVKGRKEVASLANKVAKSKVFLDDLGKDLVSEWKDKSKKVDAERKKIRDTLDLLKEEVRRPLTEFEEKEEARIKTHEDAIKSIEQFKIEFGASSESATLGAAILNLESVTVDDSWDEFKSRAEMRKNESLIYLKDLLSTRTQYEAEQVELIKFREAEAARLVKEREENIAKEAAEKARIMAEEIAKKAQEKAEIEKQAAIYKQKEAEESIRRMEEKAKAEKLDAEKRAKEAAEKAELDKQLAIKTEQVRAQKEKEQIEAEALARENNLKHKKEINNQALSDLVSFAGINEADAKKVVEAIAKAQVSNVKISY